ncbi:hypothetical protein K0P33_17520 [Pseudomonas sp. ArH3a]|nr:hypothetical protein K0P33_17520 [Pseudomonas sp. ArH3a]
MNSGIDGGIGGHEDKRWAGAKTTDAFKFAGPVSIKSRWPHVIDSSTLQGFTFVTQVAVANVAAALAIDFGIAISALIAVADVAATLATHFCKARGSKVAAANDAAALAIEFGIAISTLIAVADVAATLATGFGVAVSALIVVTDVAAPGICVGTEH